MTRAALQSGKHVYSEKPLALSLPQAEELVRLAEARERVLAGAPCTVLGEAAQTVWRELRKGSIGKVRLVYAEFDEGHGMTSSGSDARWSTPGIISPG